MAAASCVLEVPGGDFFDQNLFPQKLPKCVQNCFFDVFNVFLGVYEHIVTKKHIKKSQKIPLYLLKKELKNMRNS